MDTNHDRSHPHDACPHPGRESLLEGKEAENDRGEDEVVDRVTVENDLVESGLSTIEAILRLTQGSASG